MAIGPIVYVSLNWVPENRMLYETAKHRHPDIYEMLQILDTKLAELHAAGMNLQRQRQAILQNLITEEQRARGEVD